MILLKKLPPGPTFLLQEKVILYWRSWLWPRLNMSVRLDQGKVVESYLPHISPSSDSVLKFSHIFTYSHISPSSDLVLKFPTGIQYHILSYQYISITYISLFWSGLKIFPPAQNSRNSIGKEQEEYQIKEIPFNLCLGRTSIFDVEGVREREVNKQLDPVCLLLAATPPIKQPACWWEWWWAHIKVVMTQDHFWVTLNYHVWEEHWRAHLLKDLATWRGNAWWWFYKLSPLSQSPLLRHCCCKDSLWVLATISQPTRWCSES